MMPASCLKPRSQYQCPALNDDVRGKEDHSRVTTNPDLTRISNHFRFADDTSEKPEILAQGIGQ